MTITKTRTSDLAVKAVRLSKYESGSKFMGETRRTTWYVAIWPNSVLVLNNSSFSYGPTLYKQVSKRIKDAKTT
jgi:hypothetical protein